MQLIPLSPRQFKFFTTKPFRIVWAGVFHYLNPMTYIDTIKHLIQRSIHGYADCDLESFNIYLSKVISRALREDVDFCVNKDIRLKISEGFEAYCNLLHWITSAPKDIFIDDNGNPYPEFDFSLVKQNMRFWNERKLKLWKDEQNKKVMEGLALFQKYFDHLVD